MKKFIIFFLFCFISFSYAEDVKYTTHIKPIFESKCAGCHNGLEYEEWKAAVSKDPNMKKRYGWHEDGYF